MSLSIRIRILLLALLALGGMMALLYVEYSRHQSTLKYSQGLQARLDEMRENVGLVRELQEERGLSAGYLSAPSPELQQRLRRQRSKTDQALGTRPAQTSQPFSRQKLAQLRQRIDQGAAQWPFIREHFNHWVHDLLESSKLGAKQERLTTPSLSMMALSDLALSTEYLGLLRATLYRAYLSKTITTEDRTALAQYWALHHDHLDRFERLAPEELRMRINASLSQGNLERIGKQVRQAMTGSARLERPQAQLWWEQASLAVSQMEVLLTQGLVLLEHQIAQDQAANQARLTRYTAVAVALLAVAALLVAWTIGRILKALGVMIQTMSEVIDTQNFKLRVNAADRADEFGVIGEGINELLTYTDRLIEQKDYLATHDLLTGLFNRRKLEEMVRVEFARDDRYGQGVALIMCDLDHFKAINDRYGHQVGDKVLEAFSALVEASTRSTDVVARWGGEEFLILAPGIGEMGAKQFAEKLRKLVSELQVDGVPGITASFGVALRARKEPFEALADRADEALYQAKNKGRNRVEQAAPPEESEAAPTSGDPSPEGV